MLAKYMFLATLAALVIGNLALLSLYKKKVQFALNNLVLLFMVFVLWYIYAGGYYGTYFGFLSTSQFSVFFMILFTAAMLLANMLYYTFAQDYGELAMLGSISLVGMYVVAGSSSLVTIFLGLELVGMPMVFSLLLSKRSLEAAAKLFIMASVSIALFSFAMALTFGATGNLDLGASGYTNLMLFTAVLFIVAMGFETAAFPFNVLIPDVYEGAPAYLTGTMGGINKTAGFIALIQILILVFIAYKSAFLVVALLAIFTMFYGNIAALMQKNLKRLFAYSSISQAGYMLIGIATYTSSGISATLFQIFAHSFIFIGIFAIVAWLEMRNKSTVDDLAGLSRENRFAAFALTVFMLALIGVPFTTGFVGKLLIFLSAVSSGLAVLAVLGILNSVISIYYYAKPMIAMYSGDGHKKKVGMPPYAALAVVLCLFITVLFGIYPQSMISLVTAAAAHLFL